MKALIFIIGYLFISGLLAGAITNNVRNRCGTISGEEARRALMIALLWPEIIGATIVSNSKPEELKCEKEKL